MSEFGRIDVLFNLAGRAHFGRIESVTDEDWDAARRDEVDLIFCPTRAAWPRGSRPERSRDHPRDGRSIRYDVDGQRGETTPTLPDPRSAAAATLAAFSANGLFAGLSGLFLATTFQRPSHALAGATLFLVFTSGVVSQLATDSFKPSRVLAIGTTSMLVGLVLLVTSVHL